MVNLTYTEYTHIIDDDFKHIDFLSKGIVKTPIEKYICRLIYGLDPDVHDEEEIINRVNVFIDDVVLVRRTVKLFLSYPKEGFIHIGGTTNLMTSNGLVVTWNYRLPEARLQYGTNTVLIKVTSEAPDYNPAFKTISDIRETHNDFVIQNKRFSSICNIVCEEENDVC